MKSNRKLVASATLLVAVVVSQSSDFGAGEAQGARRFRQAEPLAIPVPSGPAGRIEAYPIPAHNVWCPSIRYRSAPCNRCFAHCTVKATLLVEDPACCGCFAKVPVCLPTCCQGEASICPRGGILGRRRVTYRWACGFTVEVLFRSRGDLVVVY